MGNPKRSTGTAFEHMRPIAMIGAIAIGVFFFGLGSWAAIAPLESAALAPGVLSVETNRKTLQHLEGGIVSEILVREGDRVEAGQPLISLDETQPRAKLEQLRTRQQGAIALEARLIAERDGLDVIRFPPSLIAHAASSKVAEAIAGEKSIFEAKLRSLDGQTAILGQRIAQYEEEIEGLRGQIAAQSRQISLIDEEVSGYERLRERKLVGNQRLIELQRERAEISGGRSQNKASIARVGQNIAEERLKMIELRTRRTGEVVAELRDTQALLFDLSEQRRAAADVLARTRINAPLNGVIVDLQVHTVGGVISSGDALMDIVPEGERLLVQARVTPEDIDSVHPGLNAQVVVTAFSRRNVPPVEGTVVSVSADRLTDSRTGLPYFLARISVPETPYGDGTDLALFPGMQAEVMIVTGERTTLDYLFRPFARSFDRALREQ